MDLIKALTSQYMKEELPEVNVGDTVLAIGADGAITGSMPNNGSTSGSIGTQLQRPIVIFHLGSCMPGITGRLAESSSTGYFSIQSSLLMAIFFYHTPSGCI